MDWISRLQGTSPSHFNTRKIDNFVYFSYISKCRRSYIKDCGRIAQRHECPIIRVKGCMCWSSFVDSFLNQTKSSKTIVTCYVRTMLNLDLLRDVNRCSVEQTSFDRAWAPTSGRFEGLCDFFLRRTCDDVSQTQRRSRWISPSKESYMQKLYKRLCTRWFDNMLVASLQHNNSLHLLYVRMTSLISLY